MAKILVVDDDPDLRALVVRRLGKAGHRVQEAANGSAALDLIRDMGDPDLLVLDVTMPGLTGLELLVAAREQTGHTNLPAVFLSGGSSPPTSPWAGRSGPPISPSPTSAARC